MSTRSFQVAVIPFALGFAILTSLGRSLDCMLMMELMKASCNLKMKDEMEQEPNRLWRAVVGHLVGRPWMVCRILQWVHSS